MGEFIEDIITGQAYISPRATIKRRRGVITIRDPVYEKHKHDFTVRTTSYMPKGECRICGFRKGGKEEYYIERIGVKTLKEAKSQQMATIHFE